LLPLENLKFYKYYPDPDLDPDLDLDPEPDPDPHSAKMLDPDPHKTDADPKHWLWH
jgi:hypothetical protein